MKIRITAFTATALFALMTALGAHAQSSDTQNKIEYKKGGGYEATTSSQSTTESGTAKSSETNVDVSVDSEGYVKEDSKTESVVDPKGLGNKKKAVQQVTTEEKPNGGYLKTTTTSETDAEGTNVSTETKTDVDVNDEGSVTATTTTKKTVDPKGLMNKQVTKSKTKSVDGKIVEENKQSN